MKKLTKKIKEKIQKVLFQEEQGAENMRKNVLKSQGENKGGDEKNGFVSMSLYKSFLASTSKDSRSRTCFCLFSMLSNMEFIPLFDDLFIYDSCVQSTQNRMMWKEKSKISFMGCHKERVSFLSTL